MYLYISTDFQRVFKLFDKKKDGFMKTNDIGYAMRDLGGNPTESLLLQISIEVDPHGKNFSRNIIQR